MSSPLKTLADLFNEQVSLSLEALTREKTVSQSYGESRRLFHGRGGSLAGLEWITIDWFDPLLIITLFKAPDESDWASFAQTLTMMAPEFAEAVIVQRRYEKGAPSEVIWGELNPPYYARRGNLRFELSVGQQQNLGFFLDMEPGRQWLEAHAKGKSVLNLFAFTCAFSVVAVEYGAKKVVNVDMSRSALSRGRENHRLNDHSLEGVSFLGENIMKSWGRIKRAGPFDVVIFDPPSFQKGSFIAERDYHKLVKRIPELMPAGGEVLACLNAPELEASFLAGLFEEYAPTCQFLERLPAHPDFPDVDDNKRLKLCHYRYDLA
ncbi:class I SAM-dependent methyltransferase [Marinibactrum halimedae]|uniref:Methyltransferase n=1 Tax=Marinibactrum halimedae TaxID=1444977 RepID=A0AA37T5W6_9GAMM|nr:class I SAM-dependent methyltransferase [Marinibactrum halimedae]MCD9457853.1 class I SAM-dependent methyltransferase [Marinibactrum halimedae]GLS26326.1 methyltransferase [Marinibactrum halimedae]